MKIPPDSKTENYLKMLNEDGCSLKTIPKEDRDVALCLAAIRQNAKAIKYIPKKIKTTVLEQVIHESEFLAEIGKNPDKILNNIPKELIDETVAIAAIQEKFDDLCFLQFWRHIPLKIINEKIFFHAIKIQGEVIFNSFKNIPQENQTEAMCLAAINNNSDAFQYVAERNKSNEVCLAAVKMNGNLLKDVPDKNKNREMCLIAIDTILSNRKIYFALSENVESGIKYVPIEFFTEEICLKIVNKDGLLLNDIPIELRSREVCTAALKKNILSIEYIPVEVFNAELALSLVQENGSLLKYIPEEMRSEKICISALRSNASAIIFVPKSILTEEICLLVVEKNGNLLRNIPDEMHSEKICIAAVRNNASAFKYIKLDNLTEGICLALVQDDPSAISRLPEKFINEEICHVVAQYVANFFNKVPEKIRDIVIDKLGPEELLTYNYDIKNHFPDSTDFGRRCNKFLSGVKHVVMAKHLDAEINDFYLLYANSEKRRGNVIYVNTKDITSLFEELNENKANEINFVLLDHATANAETMAGFSVSNITHLLKENKNINRVTLMGCSTAKSDRLDKESDLAKNLVASKQTAHQPCGFILIANMPDEKEYNKLLKSLKLDAACILIKMHVEGNDQYELIYINRNGENKINTQEFNLDLERVNKLKNNVVKGKRFNFPKKGNVILRNNQKPIEEAELNLIFKICTPFDEFSKKNPSYKQVKAKYPFLSSVTINDTDIPKLKTSLFQKLVSAIQRDIDISQDILVKGYTKSLYVDTRGQARHTSDSYLYPYENYRHSLFYTNKESIVRSKLDKNRQQLIKKMGTEKESDETDFKSIKINLRKK